MSVFKKILIPLRNLFIGLVIVYFVPNTIAQSNDDVDPILEADSVSTIDEGFSGTTDSDIDYEALVRELYGEKESQPIAEDVEAQPEARRKRQEYLGPAPGMFKNSFLNGSHFAINAASPFLVADPLISWYSFVDGSVTFKLPYEVYVESIPLYILFEISSFNFTNSYPEGGSFSGISYVFQASSIGDHSGAALGFGVWDKAMGSMLELNYRFRPTTNTFLRIGTRGVLITEIEPLGAAWWAELRFSTGFEL